MIVILTFVVFNVALGDAYTTNAPGSGTGPGSSSCTIQHSSGSYTAGPNSVITIIDSTSTTCEGYYCDGNTGTATMEFSLSATCAQGCVDVEGSTNYCKCKTGCTAPSCVAGWSEFQGACYRFFPNKQKFTVAETNCKGTMKSCLTPTKSKEEKNFVKNLAGGVTIWLGGDKRDSTQYEWFDGTSVSAGYTNWKKGEPDGSAGTLSDVNCMMMNSRGKWMDYSCTQGKKPYVCKYKP